MSLSKERRDERKVLAMKANEGRYIPLHKLYEIAAESGALLADLEEAEAKRSVFPDELYSQISKVLAKHDYPSDANLAGILDILLSGISSEIETKEKYKAQVVELETELASTRQQLAEAQAQMQNVNGCFDAAADEGLFERIAECGHSPGDGSLADLVQRRLLFAPKTEPHIALSAAIAEAVEPYKRDAERYRWLRDQHTDDGLGEYGEVSRWFVHADREPVPCDPGALDAAIDAALAAKEKEHG